jgi:hypothetical protein
MRATNGTKTRATLPPTTIESLQFTSREIELLELKLLDYSATLYQLEQAVSQSMTEVEAEVYFDSSFKNAEQREVQKKILLSQSPHKERLDALEQGKRSYKRLQIELNRLLREFSTYKLIERKEIAVIELRTAHS